MQLWRIFRLKKFLIPLIASLSLPTAINAEKLCTITSELDKDIVIKIEGDNLGMFGRITYKNNPMYRISFFHMNGYVGIDIPLVKIKTQIFHGKILNIQNILVVG